MARFLERVGESVPRHIRSVGERGKSPFRHHDGTDGADCIHLCEPAVAECAGGSHHLVATWRFHLLHDAV